MPDLLLEIGIEEIPAGYVPGALDALRTRAAEGLAAVGLTHGDVITTATPRRLVLAVRDLPRETPAREEVVSGPPEGAAYRDGEPTPAATGFARKQGVDVTDLYIEETGKGRYVHAKVTTPGRDASELLAELLPGVVSGMGWPKSMRWPQAVAPAAPAPAGKKGKKGKKKKAKAPSFCRPVRRVMCLLGNRILPIEIFGIPSHRLTAGHPYLTGERRIALERADYTAFRSLLKQHQVIADRDERREVIRAALAAAFAERGAELRHPELVDEVTDLCELPTVLVGSFEERYLDLPADVIDCAMTEHQRYFPLYKADGSLLPVFAFVSDRPARTKELIIEGNERVLRARLEDALFYLTEDLKRPLAERGPDLAGITHHEKLGTALERAERIAALTAMFAQRLGLSEADQEAADRAAALCKADLTTDLVCEFPKLQGTIGGEYARRQGEPEAVQAAIAEHYRPRYSGDELPTTPAGQALALADKLDHLACFFALGFAPTGSTDPFALRRSALGVVRIVAETGLDVSVSALVAAAVEAVPARACADRPALRQQVEAFLGERIGAFFKAQGFRYDLVAAALASKPLDSVEDLKSRLGGVQTIREREDFATLYQIVERTLNISKALDDPAKGVARAAVREDLLTQDEEKALFAAYQAVEGPFGDAVAAGRYDGAASLYVEGLGDAVEAFFDKVLVNAEDLEVRANRLSLCRDLHDLFARRIADLTHVVMDG